MTNYDLSPLQAEGVSWLQEREKRYLADPPGFGKTRQLLAAVGEVPTLVVCPAAIRDAGVWDTEAKAVDWRAPMKVISYHQLAQGKKHADPFDYDAVIFDEAHHLKNRNVSWGLPAQQLGRLIDTVYLGSGTPTPNDASELWGQHRVIRPDLPAFWPWADGNTKENAKGWFHISSHKDRAGRTLSEYVIAGHLQACVEAGCVNAQRDPKTGNLMPITEEDCEHWAEFRRLEQEPYMLGRPEELLDLPPMSGHDTPLWTPMKPEQKKLYKSLQKDFLAELDDGSVSIEALSDSQKFVQLWMLATGVGSVDPTQDPDDRHSGKLALAAEMLANRSTPTLLGTYFRNSAVAAGRVCERLKKRYAFFGANTPAAERRRVVESFQRGEIDVLIGSIAVVGEGLTLTAADGVMLLERMWTPDKNSQVIRRVRRRGQTKEVGVRQLVTPDTVDGGQWEALKVKRTRIARVDVAQLVAGRYAEIG